VVVEQVLPPTIHTVLQSAPPKPSLQPPDVGFDATFESVHLSIFYPVHEPHVLSVFKK